MLSHYPIQIFLVWLCTTQQKALLYFLQTIEMFAFSNPNPGKCTHIPPNWEITTIFISVLKLI